MLFDHLDTRVRSIAGVRPFYDALMAALGLPRPASDDENVTYYPLGDKRREPFFGISQHADHQPNETRIAFAGATRADVDRIARAAEAAGARAFEAPKLCLEYSETYYASFFEDPEGNKFEVCCRA